MVIIHLYPDSPEPITNGASVYICAYQRTFIPHNGQARIATGLCVKSAMVIGRAHSDLQLVNGAGICHPDRDDELDLWLVNYGPDRWVLPGERVAQLVEVPTYAVE